MSMQVPAQVSVSTTPAKVDLFLGKKFVSLTIGATNVLANIVTELSKTHNPEGDYITLTANKRYLLRAPKNKAIYALWFKTDAGNSTVNLLAGNVEVFEDATSITPYIFNGAGSPIPANTSLYDSLTFKHQPVINFTQFNPIGSQRYTVLNNVKNARLINFWASINWTAQPDVLRVYCTIDGNEISFGVANPVSATSYFPVIATGASLNASASLTPRAFLLEGRDIKVEVYYEGGVVSELRTYLFHAKR